MSIPSLVEMLDENLRFVWGLSVCFYLLLELGQQVKHLRKAHWLCCLLVFLIHQNLFVWGWCCQSISFQLFRSGLQNRKLWQHLFFQECEIQIFLIAETLFRYFWSEWGFIFRLRKSFSVTVQQYEYLFPLAHNKWSKCLESKIERVDFPAFFWSLWKALYWRPWMEKRPVHEIKFFVCYFRRRLLFSIQLYVSAD